MHTDNMEHRPSTGQTQMSEMDHERIWNHMQHDRRLNLGNVSFMFPADNIAANGLNSMAYFNPTLRSNDLQLTNFSSDVPRHMTANTTTSCDPYMCLPSGGSISQLSPQFSQHGSSYNQLALRHVSGNANPLLHYERATYKRKNPANSILADRGDRGNRSGYYCVGSSSNPTTSTENLWPKRMLDSQCQPWDPVCFVHSHRSDNASSSELGSQRNVRRRHGNVTHLENISSGSGSSSILSHHFHSAAIASGAHMAEQWINTPISANPNRRGFSSEIGSFNHEIHQSYVTTHANNSNMEIGGYSSNLSPQPTLNGPWTRGLVVDPSSYGQRTPFRANPSCPTMGLGATTDDVRLTRVESAVPSWYSRPLSIGRQNNERNRRARNRYNRFLSSSDEDTTRIRWTPDGVAMHLFDQHHDMRLDIDNMSYEELLALEERIGTVSTGLSEVAITRCLTETIYCSSDQIQDDQEEDSCAICLEEYKDRDCLGRLNCKHIFHSSCITKWLLIKNICPICKTSDLEDALKEK